MTGKYSSRSSPNSKFVAYQQQVCRLSMYFNQSTKFSITTICCNKINYNQQLDVHIAFDS